MTEAFEELSAREKVRELRRIIAEQEIHILDLEDEKRDLKNQIADIIEANS